MCLQLDGNRTKSDKSLLFKCGKCAEQNQIEVKGELFYHIFICFASLAVMCCFHPFFQIIIDGAWNVAPTVGA